MQQGNNNYCYVMLIKDIVSLFKHTGARAESRNHYRGHKLSMWLSLIPQLHSPGDAAELNMRHHHFLEDSAQYYDGKYIRLTILRSSPLN